MMLSTLEEQVEQDMMMATSMEDVIIPNIVDKEAIMLANQFNEINLKEVDNYMDLFLMEIYSNKGRS